MVTRASPFRRFGRDQHTTVRNAYYFEQSLRRSLPGRISDEGALTYAKSPTTTTPSVPSPELYCPLRLTVGRPVSDLVCPVLPPRQSPGPYTTDRSNFRLLSIDLTAKE